MRKQFRSKISSGFIVMTLALFATGCSTDDGSVFQTPTDPTDPDTENPAEPKVATLTFNEADPSKNVPDAKASGTVGTKVPGRVMFTSTDITQKRMYITQNVSGEGDMPFNDFALEDTDLKKALKGDGSIDLDTSNKKDIDFTFDLPVPAIENGEIVYSFWTTTGKGDFRDAEKRLALGVGTITVKIGNGTNPIADVREFTGIKLFAPAQDGNSKTFFSLLNETVYNITDGPEFRAFWDFGYYYTPGAKASLASTANYKEVFNFEVAGFEAGDGEDDAENESLNEAFFKLSAKTSEEFDALSKSGDLDAIDKPASQNISDLKVGDVIEFVDNYEKKGYVEITEIKAGFNTNDFIVFDVKIQP